ncbi:MAG TPA: ABC transporter ATP-binding protein [Planctomycetota bacterium]|nr:ABC transporter ATP-binding protein [Planctomycetota bacterium]
MSEILQAVDVHKSYRVGRERLHVLRGVNLSVKTGEILAVVGASGVGKSTLLHILGALDEPDQGRVLYDGQEVFKLSHAKQDAIRNRTFGFVFQFYYLLPEFTALENVLMPAMVGRGVVGWLRSRRRLRRKATELLERLGLGGRARHRPSQLSGGEEQRVAIARALINDPPVLLCDEPTGNLDERTARGITDALWKLNRDTGQTTVLVTHNLELARRAHRVVHLTGGRVEPMTNIQ